MRLFEGQLRCQVMLNLQDSQTRQQKSVNSHTDHIGHQDIFSHRHFSIPISLKTPCSKGLYLAKAYDRVNHSVNDRCVGAAWPAYSMIIKFSPATRCTLAASISSPSPKLSKKRKIRRTRLLGALPACKPFKASLTHS